MNNRTYLYFLLKMAFLCFVLGTTSCLKKKTSPYTDYKLEETFRYPIISEPPTLDWNKSTDTTSSLVIQSLMEGLTEYDFSGKFVQLRPALAQSWSNSADKKYGILSYRKMFCGQME